MNTKKQQLFLADGGQATINAQEDLGRKLVDYGKHLVEMPWTGVRTNEDGTKTVVTSMTERCNIAKCEPEEWRNLETVRNGVRSYTTGEVAIYGWMYSTPYRVTSKEFNYADRKADLVGLMKRACEANGVKTAEAAIKNSGSKNNSSRHYATLMFRDQTSKHWKKGIKASNMPQFPVYSPKKGDITDINGELRHVEENAKIFLTLSELALKVYSELGDATYTNDKTYMNGGRTIRVDANGYNLSYNLPYMAVKTEEEIDAAERARKAQEAEDERRRQQEREEYEKKVREQAEVDAKEADAKKAEEEARRAEADAKKAEEETQKAKTRAEMAEKWAPIVVLGTLIVAIIVVSIIKNH